MGLLLAPADAIGPAFGPGSCRSPPRAAERAGFEVAPRPLESMALDLDTPDDLAALARGARERPERAPGTAEALAELGRAVGRAMSAGLEIVGDRRPAGDRGGGAGSAT